MLVGKGITFDTGGLSIKPGEGMMNMKRDMTGAGVVLSVMGALADGRLPGQGDRAPVPAPRTASTATRCDPAT